MYEYCVMLKDYPQQPHRGPWPEAECIEWVRESEEDDGFRPGYFYVAQREVGPWHK